MFKSEGRGERELDRQIGAAVMQMLYQSIYNPVLNYGHNLWVVTKRTTLQTKAEQISFLRNVTCFSLRDKRRSSKIWEELRVELPLLHIKRSQFRCFGHQTRMSPGCSFTPHS